ncbi:MAG: helix-turn-helix transcriptional regulator [Dysgonamonadaceae bacterium]|jgi:AraC-like DNA-binding protein|nr:helix-turn-helix transcriptional regulator [Dysgonamonadaceae bacterium]
MNPLRFPEPLKALNFRILPLAGPDICDASLLHPHSHCGNELIFITSGHLVRKCDFNDIRLNKNEIHLSLARQIAFVSEWSDDVRGYYCRFDDAFLEQIYLQDNIENDLEFISSFLSRYPLRLTLAAASRITYLLEALLQLHDEKSAHHFPLMHVYLVALIYEMKMMMIESGLDFYPSKAFLITKRYNDLLAKYIEKERSMEFYARSLNITPNHLNKSVKSVTGRTAVTLLNEIRIREAKMRLKYTNLTINEIAFQLGFDDQSYFSRFFKKAAGCSPMEYRNGK